jgi:cytochrome P450
MTGTVTAEAEAVVEALFRTPEGRTDPYPLYHRLRRLAPVHRSETVAAWVLTRYDDCQAVIRDPRLVRGWGSRLDALRPDWRDRPALARMDESMLMLDGPAHTRLRRLVVRAFPPKTIERLRPQVERIVDGLFDPLAEAGGGELMADFAFPLPVQVIAELLGVPPSDCLPFRDRALRLTAMFELGANETMLDAADAAQLECDAYFAELLDHKRAHPGADLLSDLLAVEEDGDRLGVDELSNLALLLFVAGFETTTNLIGNTVLGFSAHPEAAELLGRQPGLGKTLPDELLRYDGPVQFVSRLTDDTIELDGVVIPPGESVMALIGAANRDPRRYVEPDRLDPTRPDVKPLTFGGGPHFCLGAALARMETEVVFSRLFERFGTIEVAGPAPYRDRLALRGPTALPVTLAPRSVQPTVIGMVRPGRGDDLAWRDQFRARLEAAPARTGAEVDAIAALFGRVGFFAGCNESELASLAGTAYPITFDAGDVICDEGEDAAECYVIAEGEAHVSVANRHLAAVGADDVVGERGPLLGLPRSARVTATTHLAAYAISRRRLHHIAAANPEAGNVMEEFIRTRQPDLAA